jgi:ATP-dependent protease ClpP protease subunit
MSRVLCTCLAILLLGVACRTSEGQPASVEGRVQCDEVCSIQDFRLRGEIGAETVGAIQKLIGELHRLAEQDKKEIQGGILEISSPGGSVHAAMAIGRLVRKEGVEVGVDANSLCSSACVLILAGGVMRFFIDNVGIHAPYFEVPAQQINPENVRRSYGALLQDIRAYFREMNISENLADAMLRIPPGDVHFLTNEEASTYGLTMVDPVFQETLDLKQAQKYGLDRREYAVGHNPYLLLLSSGRRCRKV